MEKTFIDIHTHILPRIDDGAQSIDESMQMLHTAYNEGIRTMIATPHYGMEYQYTQKECEKDIVKLNNVINNDARLKGMKVLLGNELLYHVDISRDIKQGLANTLAGTNYVLVEFFTDAPLSSLEACAREMNMAGYRPIFAHVERYFCLYDDIGKLEWLKGLGALLQVNSLELIELPQKESKGLFKRKNFDPDEERSRIAWQYVLSGLVDFIASDTHSNKWRPPIMKTAFDNIRQVGGDELADMLIQNAENILK